MSTLPGSSLRPASSTCTPTRTSRCSTTLAARARRTRASPPRSPATAARRLFRPAFSADLSSGGARRSQPLPVSPTEWEWSDLDGWADGLESNRIGLNVMPQVGHTALKLASGAPLSRPANDEELATMRRLAAEAVEQGAVAVTNGLTGHHYANAPTSEIAARGRGRRPVRERLLLVARQAVGRGELQGGRGGGRDRPHHGRPGQLLAHRHHRFAVPRTRRGDGGHPRARAGRRAWTSPSTSTHTPPPPPAFELSPHPGWSWAASRPHTGAAARSRHSGTGPDRDGAWMVGRHPLGLGLHRHLQGRSRGRSRSSRTVGGRHRSLQKRRTARHPTST